MNTLDGRLVVVQAGLLDEVLELARLAADRLPEQDPLASSLRGATAEMRTRALLEP